jgi:putative membrane protein
VTGSPASDRSVKKFLQSWLINTLAVLVAVYLYHGIHYQQWLDLLVASLLLGIFNAFLRPLLMLLALPLLIFTLGLFTLFINAILLYFVSLLLRPHFYVDSFGAAFWGALIISLVSLILNTLTGSGSSRIHFQRHRRPPDRGGGGPVIDI